MFISLKKKHNKIRSTITSFIGESLVIGGHVPKKVISEYNFEQAPYLNSMKDLVQKIML